MIIFLDGLEPTPELSEVDQNGEFEEIERGNLVYDVVNVFVLILAD